MKKNFVILTAILLTAIYFTGCSIPQISTFVGEEEAKRVFGSLQKPWNTVTTPSSEMFAQGMEFCYKLKIEMPPEKAAGYQAVLGKVEMNLLDIVPNAYFSMCDNNVTVTLKVRATDKTEKASCTAKLPTVSDTSVDKNPQPFRCVLTGTQLTVKEGDEYFFCIRYPWYCTVIYSSSIVHHEGGDGIDSTYGEVLDESTGTWKSMRENEEYITLYDTNDNEIQSHDAILYPESFEGGAANWTKSSAYTYGIISLESSIYKSEPYSLKLSRNAQHTTGENGQIGIEQIAEIENNEIYYLNARVYIDTNMDEGAISGIVISSVTSGVEENSIYVIAYATPEQQLDATANYFTITKLESNGIPLFADATAYTKGQWLWIKNLQINNLFSLANDAVQAEGKTIQMKDMIIVKPRVWTNNELTVGDKYFTMYIDDISVTPTMLTS